jgi:anti-sigma factor RsiW
MSHSVPTEAQELHAYVDDQLSPELRRRVEARLATSPDERKRVEAYAAIRRDLHRLFDPVSSEPVPTVLSRRRRRWQRPLGAIAAGLVLLATGIWTGLHLQIDVVTPVADASQPHIVREAVMAYAIYTPEVRHPVEVSGDQEQHLVAWLSKRLGGEVRAPKLEKLGFKLVGGRLLASDDGPGALFMYENSDGRRITLSVCQFEESGHNTAFRYAEQDGISVFYWYDGPFSYAMAGDIGRHDLLSLAESVYQQIVL